MPRLPRRPVSPPPPRKVSEQGEASVDDGAVTGPIQAAYARYARQAGGWIERYEARGGHVYCGAGCALCCDMPIRVSLAEALLTAGALNPEEAGRMAAHARAVQENARTAPDEETFVERHRAGISFCPLLDRSTGRCTQYEVRPTRCRDTFSAFPARFCGAGYWESLSSREQASYRREVARTPGTDGEIHYIAPLEHLSEPVWVAASRAMRQHWGLEVWGDFWTLTTLARDPEFMQAIRAGQPSQARSRARTLGLAHPVTLEIER